MRTAQGIASGGAKICANQRWIRWHALGRGRRGSPNCDQQH